MISGAYTRPRALGRDGTRQTRSRRDTSNSVETGHGKLGRDGTYQLHQTVDEISDFHGLEAGLPSIHRCLAQWPAFLEPAWNDLEPIFESGAFDRGCDAPM
ncbi:hypothetical protein [Natrinema halophilum]|uniref:Uncharacterized protein n=1 Tax=Natrinema halophilum TaxID=1699371 RepID=A0A7D5GKM1_9EURY|nr:hypothetical protein [Natrinema halophilum]QLG48772.1 halocarboxylic acid dehydrogenase DehI family protein [Natrinema halophilum]